MYDDSWYSYVPETRKDEVAPHRRGSLLNQSNGINQPLDLPKPTLDLLQASSRPDEPPKATLARRAKSYSNFYNAAVAYFESETIKRDLSRPQDEYQDEYQANDRRFKAGNDYENFEDDLLVASQAEYQLYGDQLALSERHLDSLLENTTSTLQILVNLSDSFKAVESQTTAFQAQCEDLLAEQKRLRCLADEVGTDLQYYAYLEPLTRRLNAPGASRLIKNDDFLDMLSNLNACIEFMDHHPAYRDSTVYKTRYISLLERSLNVVQSNFTSALKEISDEVSKQLRLKELNETTEYILLFGKYEAVVERLGVPMEKLLASSQFAFGRKGDITDRTSYIHQWHELYKQIVEAFLKSREVVNPVLLKNLRNFTSSDPKPDSDFKSFARRCVQYVFDICHNEQKLVEKFFLGGPLLADYSNSTLEISVNYAERLEQARFTHITTLHTFLAPHLSSGDLHRVSDLVNWLETMYLVTADSDDEDNPDQEHMAAAHGLLSEHLWPLSDSLFIKAAAELEHFKPTEDNLKFTIRAPTSPKDEKRPSTSHSTDSKVHISNDAHVSVGPGVQNAYPTVKTAVKLLIMYNDSMFDRPKKGDVLYEILHQALISLQLAATHIKRHTSNSISAQLFLIKNLLLISNLFLTHEIPESIRQSAELDFTPIWDTIRELQAKRQLFNPLAYITPLVRGRLLPAVRDQVLDARKELEGVLVRQVRGFARTWRERLVRAKTERERAVVEKELDDLLNSVFEEETTKRALWKMVRAEEYE